MDNALNFRLTRHIGVALCLLALLASPVLAQNEPAEPPLPDDPEVPFTTESGDAEDLEGLRALMAEAAENNPELRARFTEYRQQLENIPQVGSLPDPEVMFSFFTNPQEADPIPGRFMGEAMQMFPWFGTLSAREEREERFAEAQLQRFERAKLDLFRDVQQAWFEVAGIQRAIELTEQNLELLESLRPLVDVRYETAQDGQVDALRIRMEQDELETRLRNLEDERRPAVAKLNELLNRDPTASVEVPEQLPDALLDLGGLPDPTFQRIAADGGLGEAVLDTPVDTLREAFVDVITRQDPSLRALEAEAEGYRASDRVARKEGRPSFGLGVEVMGRDFGPMRMMDGGESIFAKASISIPLHREQYRAQRRQAELGQERVELERERLMNRVDAQVEELLRAYREATRDIELYRERLIPRATQSLDILETDYTGGRARFDEIIQMQRQLLDYAIQLVNAQVTQHQVRAELEALAGVGLDIRPDYQE